MSFLFYDAAANLRKSLLAYKWFVDVSVLHRNVVNTFVKNKSDTREIVVYVTDNEHIQDKTTYNSWPVRYEIGVKRT